jgi:erythromycin esterase
MTRFPTEAARGKHLRLTGSIRTQDISRGWAGLWVRVDSRDRVLALDNMGDRGVRGTTLWSSIEAEVDVPAEATGIALGALLTGDGSAWVSDLMVVIEPAWQNVEGKVEDPAGKPVSGALVAVQSEIPGEAKVLRSDAKGGFRTVVPAGRIGLTATAAWFEAAAASPEQVRRQTGAGGGPVLRLGGGGVQLVGTLMHQASQPPAGTRVRLTRPGPNGGTLFFSELDRAGTFIAGLAPGTYQVALETAGYDLHPDFVRLAPGAGRQVRRFTAAPLEPVPDTVMEWLREHVHTLRTVTPGQGLADLEPLAGMVGNARVVALGEADHGTREFSMLKHRVLELLVTRMGFSVLAIEANWPETLGLDNYVLHGNGDPAKLLSRLSFACNTAEVLNVVRWMRAYNADPAHTRKLRFFGFDCQAAGLASQVLAAYLQRVDPDYARGVMERFAAIPDDPRRATEAERTAARSTARLALARLDANQAAYSSASSREEWEQVRQHAVILQQAVGLADTHDPESRERAMAENIRWILAHQPSGTRMVAWAHNGHVSHETSGNGEQPMGTHLRQTLGDGYLSVGLLADHGCFQALRVSGPDPQRPLQVPFGPSPVGSFANAMHRTGIALSFLDLRQRPAAGAVADWLIAPHLVHESGAFYLPGMDLYAALPVASRFDGLLFVDSTNASSLIPP